MTAWLKAFLLEQLLPIATKLTSSGFCNVLSNDKGLWLIPHGLLIQMLDFLPRYLRVSEVSVACACHHSFPVLPGLLLALPWLFGPCCRRGLLGEHICCTGTCFHVAPAHSRFSHWWFINWGILIFQAWSKKQKHMHSKHVMYCNGLLSKYLNIACQVQIGLLNQSCSEWSYMGSACVLFLLQVANGVAGSLFVSFLCLMVPIQSYREML